MGLAGGLSFGQLSIAQSNSNTLIRITATNEVLASLTGVNANLITAADFIAVLSWGAAIVLCRKLRAILLGRRSANALGAANF